MTCATCGYPMAWSVDKGRVWCSVYGATHAATPTPLMLAADLEAAHAEYEHRRDTNARHVARLRRVS